jgi:ABC-2 type transport system permease protein
MIGTLVRIGWTNLRRDRVAQSLTFLLPIVFFSIFAMVFGNQRNPTQKIRVAVVDEDQSEYSKKLVDALKAEGPLRVQTTTGDTETGVLLDPAAAERLIKDGALSVAVVLPKGLGSAPRFWRDATTPAPKVQILADVSDPIAPQMVMGLLQEASFTAMPESMAVEGMSLFERYGGPLTPAQRQSADRWLSEMRRGTAPSGGEPRTSRQSTPIGLATEVVNVMQPGRGNTATISFYAAGVGVMFLLFSCAAAGGSLLDEEESGTLGRLLSSRAGMSGVLAGKWVFLTLVGVGQLCLMFTWGAVMFKLPLLSHLPGFFVMTVFTAAAAAAFGLVLATLSRSRQQLSGISTILILTMSALGGSMFPRFLMSPTMQKIGLVTFNAWALDGYIKVFWREAPVSDLWLQVLVLMGLTVVFLAAARVLARRWET